MSNLIAGMQIDRVHLWSRLRHAMNAVERRPRVTLVNDHAVEQAHGGTAGGTGPFTPGSTLSMRRTYREPPRATGTTTGWRVASIRSALRWVACLVCPVGLVACASMAPPYARPEPPVGDRYAAGETAAAAASVVSWRDYFADARVRSLIEQALAHNRDLRAAVLRVEEARAAYRIQRADGAPTVSATAGGVRGRLPGSGLTGQSIALEQLVVGVGISSWELDFWGRVRSVNDAALEDYLATDAARRAATLSVVAEVADGYLALAELDERLALARRSAASRQESLRIFRRRVEVGATSKLELTQVEVLWHQAIALVAELELSRATRTHAMALLVGASIDLSSVSARLDDAAMFPELDPGLPSELLTRRPDIMASEHGLKAANASIGAVRAAFFPRISLTGLLGVVSPELDRLFHADSRAWIFSPSAMLPIFDAGRRRATRDLAEVRREQAVVRYERAIQAAFRDVLDALSARQWLDEQVRTLGASLAVQTERARLATLRYDSGAARYLEVLDAERDLLAVEQQLVQVRRARLASRVALWAALGGGL